MMKNITKHFRCPSGRSDKGQADWDRWLMESLDWGCDWLDHLNDHMNPWPAQAVEELCDRMEEAEAKIADLESQLAVWGDLDPAAVGELIKACKNLSRLDHRDASYRAVECAAVVKALAALGVENG